MNKSGWIVLSVIVIVVVVGAFGFNLTSSLARVESKVATLEGRIDDVEGYLGKKETLLGVARDAEGEYEQAYSVLEDAMLTRELLRGIGSADDGPFIVLTRNPRVIALAPDFGLWATTYVHVGKLTVNFFPGEWHWYHKVGDPIAQADWLYFVDDSGNYLGKYGLFRHREQVRPDLILYELGDELGFSSTPPVWFPGN